jgi:hypothetical protein
MILLRWSAPRRESAMFRAAPGIANTAGRWIRAVPLRRTRISCEPGFHTMLLKLIALLSAAIPLILFLRKVFGARPTKLGGAMREAKKQIDLAITIFIGIVGTIVVFTLGKIAWSWWMGL